MDCIQLSLFGKTCQEHSVPTEEKISEPCWKNLPAWNNQTFQFLDLRVGGADGAKPEQSQETDGVWLGDSSMLNTGESPREENVSLLSQILEDNVPQKYCLSVQACQGILTRASRRGKPLPEVLRQALLNVIGGGNSYTLKIRSGCDGGGKGALVQVEKSATLSTRQDQTLFVADVLPFDTTQVTSPQNGCNPKWGDTCHPLAASAHTPSIVIKVTFDNHAQDARHSELKGVCQTVTARWGTGGGSTPIVAHQTFNEQSFSSYKESDKCSTLKAKAGNIGNGSECLVAEKTVRWIVRRLTPVECERLQGYPSGWTDIGDWTDSKGKKHKYADSPRYKALGNSIALPQWFWLVQKMCPFLKEKPTLGSLFDGIGGFPLIWQKTYGNGTARWASEVDSFCIAVTKRRFGEE
jgi:DNA (cytosine-5)-methyltransferase 1